MEWQQTFWLGGVSQRKDRNKRHFRWVAFLNDKNATRGVLVEGRVTRNGVTTGFYSGHPGRSVLTICLESD